MPQPVIKRVIKKTLKKLKYPKLVLLFLSFLSAYLLFSNREYLVFQDMLQNLGYLGSFFAGLFFVYGFTAAPATAILLILAKQQNIFLASILAGFGALLGDLLVFNFIKSSFMDEIREFSKEKLVILIRRKIPDFLENYFLPVIAGFVIASPLPDEIGVALMASSPKISLRVFSIMAFLLNTLGIFVILLIGGLV